VVLYVGVLLHCEGESRGLRLRRRRRCRIQEGGDLE
jgi:hypothetical protein